MCGIAGIWQLTGRVIPSTDLERMTRSLSHRGPDGEGFHYDDGGALALGHRRLAILDRSNNGHQPMGYALGRYWITYNGEVYNFLEIRQELESHGYTFSTQTDTEVVVAAYDRWGVDCQLRFNGMWAFAVWDRKSRSLFLSRDRYGVKPLYYVTEPGRFLFASEMKAFLHLHDFAVQTNEMALAKVISDPFSLEGGEETLLKGVRRLGGGHCLLVQNGAVKTWRWWSTLDHIDTPPRRLTEQAEQFRALFFDACRIRMRSDVPVATCLSGGVDSSAVLCSVATVAAQPASADERRANDWQRAFVATFPGTPLDERRYADIAINRVGALACYVEDTFAITTDELSRIVYDFEEVYLTLPAPIWRLYRSIRRTGVPVSLDGHGADELLGGYSNYVAVALRGSGGLLRAPLRTWDLLQTEHHLYPEGGPLAAPGRIRSLLRNDPILSVPRRIKSLISRLRARTRECESRISIGVPSAEDEAAVERLGPLSARLYRDFHHTVLPTILRNFDRCSMAHGVEVRMPFLDWRLVCFAFSLPETSKIGAGVTKRVLREAMHGVMPEALRMRRGKIGFNAPLPRWFAGPLREWIRAAVNSADFLASDLWDGPAVRRFVEERFAAGSWTWSECQEVWPLLAAYAWQTSFPRTRA